MHNHKMVKCRECEYVIRQCRCINACKNVEYELCDSCRNKKNMNLPGDMLGTGIPEKRLLN